MAHTNQLNNQHLLWRAGFGPAVEQLRQLADYTPQQYYKSLAAASAAAPQYLNVVDEGLLQLYEDFMDVQKRSALSATDRRALQRRQQDAVRRLNISWLKEMVASRAQLREKMAFFWHGHFASRNNNIFYNQLLLQTIRSHALGNFATLLREVSRSASMLYFLNNQQNKKGHPNENFAREVMELFTLGRGNYTEHDIKEAARAFTGWTANNRGEFIYRKNQHDAGVKTVLGKTGNFDGEDVLNIILAQPQVSLFITEKIYRFFVNDTPRRDTVQSLAKIFRDSGYDISTLMQHIFTASWFYDKANIGAIIKPPVVLLAGIQRMIPMKLDNDSALLNLQKILGQQLLYPPNVAGWPGGTNWIDSSTLMMRLRIPQLFNDKDVLNIAPKQDDDVAMGMKSSGQPAIQGNKKNNAGLINAIMDWPQYLQKFDDVKREDLAAGIADYLLQANPHRIEKNMEAYFNTDNKAAYIKAATIHLMSTPEYQMC